MLYGQIYFLSKFCYVDKIKYLCFYYLQADIYDEYEDEDDVNGEDDPNKKPCLLEYRVDDRFEDSVSYNSDTDLPSSLSEYVTSETDAKPMVSWHIFK